MNTATMWWIRFFGAVKMMMNFADSSEEQKIVVERALNNYYNWIFDQFISNKKSSDYTLEGVNKFPEFQHCLKNLFFEINVANRGDVMRSIATMLDSYKRTLSATREHDVNYYESAIKIEAGVIFHMLNGKTYNEACMEAS